MKVGMTLVAVGCLLSAVHGQWLETTIEVGHPPSAVCYNTQDNKLSCVTSAETLGMLVFDGGTNVVTDTVPYSRSGYGLCYNPIENEVYWSTVDHRARPNGLIFVVDGSTNTLLDTMGTPPPQSAVYTLMCLNSTSNKLYAFAYGMLAYTNIFDCSTRELLGWKYGRPLVHNPADNKLYVSVTELASYLAIIDGVGDSLLDTLPSVRGARSACHNPLQGKVYVEQGSFVCVVDGAGDSLLGTIPVPGLSMCYDLTDDKLYCAGDGPLVAVIDCSDDTVLTTIDVGRPVSGLLHDSSYNNVYCISRDGNDVAVVDCSEDTVLATIAVGVEPSSFCCNPEYDRIYIANAGDSTISVIRTDPDTTAVAEEVVNRPAQRLGLFARNALDLTGKMPAVLLDITGREVMALQPGRNDIRLVAPGVYFVRQKEGDRTTKVVVQK